MFVVLMSSVNGRSGGELVDTSGVVQHKSVTQSSASSGHEVRQSSAAMHTASSSRPSSARSRPLSSIEMASTGVGPSLPQSYVNTPRDTETTAKPNSIERETTPVRDTELSITSVTSKTSSDTSRSIRAVSHHDDVSRISAASESPNVKSSVTHESSRPTSSQPGNHDRPKTPRLALYSHSVLTAIFPAEPGLAGFIEAKDGGNGGDSWSCKSCKAPNKIVTTANQHPTFHRLNVLPVAQLTVSKH